jgi:hypothetical protein
MLCSFIAGRSYRRLQESQMISRYLKGDLRTAVCFAALVMSICAYYLPLRIISLLASLVHYSRTWCFGSYV